MAGQSKTYCILPFVHSHASVSGHWKPCCNSVVSENSKELNLYNDKGHTHKTWFESPRMDLLRKNLSSGVRDPMCSICWKSEDVSGTSMRTRYSDGSIENAKFGHIIKEQRVKEKLTRKKDKELKIKYLDLKIGNECNLKCRMCDYTNSSKILEDVVAIENDKSLELPIEWHRSPRHEAVMDEKGIKSMPERVVREIIDDILPDLRVLKVTGGEPMVQRQVLELFKVCVDKDYAKNIELYITTNGTKFTKKFMEGIRTFKKVSFNVSCDGYGKVYDYIRYPFNWKKFAQRVDEVIKASKEQKRLMPITICPLAQMYNIETLHKLQKWTSEFNETNVDFYCNTFLQPLTSYNSLRNVPVDILEYAHERIIETPNTVTLTRYLESLIKDKKAGNIIVDESTERLIYNSVKAKDKIRNQRFGDFVGPRTSKWLEGIFKKYA